MPSRSTSTRSPAGSRKRTLISLSRRTPVSALASRKKKKERYGRLSFFYAVVVQLFELHCKFQIVVKMPTITKNQLSHREESHHFRQSHAKRKQRKNMVCYCFFTVTTAKYKMNFLVILGSHEKFENDDRSASCERKPLSPTESRKMEILKKYGTFLFFRSRFRNTNIGFHCDLQVFLKILTTKDSRKYSSP